MLTDIFAYRYADVPMWDAFEERDRRLIVQTFRIIKDQLYPPYSSDGSKLTWNHDKWKNIHDKLSTELGVRQLSPLAYSYQTTWNGKPYTHTGTWTYDYVCEQYVCADFQAGWDPDVFIKNRLSFVEIAFREGGEQVSNANAALPAKIVEAKIRTAARPTSTKIPGDPESGVSAANKTLNKDFQAAVDELNERFRQARYRLNYHNGFIQIVGDERATLRSGV